jgi:hypothetical protein
MRGILWTTKDIKDTKDTKSSEAMWMTSRGLSLTPG